MVGSAVETMVWSSDARNIPSMRAPRTTRMRRCSAGVTPSSGIGGGAARSDATPGLQVVLERGGEPPQQRGEGGQLGLVPTLEQLRHPGPAGPQDLVEGAAP